MAGLGLTKYLIEVMNMLFYCLAMRKCPVSRECCCKMLPMSFKTTPQLLKEVPLLLMVIFPVYHFAVGTLDLLPLSKPLSDHIVNTTVQ